jgi:hypothetical protein
MTTLLFVIPLGLAVLVTVCLGRWPARLALIPAASLGFLVGAVVSLLWTSIEPGTPGIAQKLPMLLLWGSIFAAAFSAVSAVPYWIARKVFLRTGGVSRRRSA